MLVAGVDVCFGTHEDDAVEVVNVDVDEDPEESAKDLLAYLDEVLWKRDACGKRPQMRPSDSTLSERFILF